MASPDFREYVDLTINDVQPDNIYQGSVTYARTALPEFTPRTGTVEDALLQAMAYVGGVMSGAINRLPDGLMEGMLRILGFERSEATFATGAVIFTAIDDAGVTVPAGTQVVYREVTDSGTINHVFSTDLSVTIGSGNTESAAVAMTAVLAGQKPTISDGDTLLIATATNRLLSAEFDGTLTQGGASESDEDYFTRGRAYMASLNSSLATAEQLVNYILVNYGDVYRAKVLDTTFLHNGTGNTATESSGSVTFDLDFDPTALVPAPLATDVIRVYGSTSTAFNQIYTINSLTSSTIVVDTPSNISAGASVGSDEFTVEFLDSVGTGASATGGFTLAVIAGEEGAAVSDSVRSSIETDVAGKIVAGLTFDTMNALILPVEVTVQIAVIDGYDEVTVRSAVDTAVTAMLSPDVWDWSSRIRANSVLSRAASVTGVEYVSSVTLALDASETLAQISGSDILFNYRGVLPEASVTVGAI